MKPKTISEQLTLLSEIYRQPISKDLPKIWFQIFQEYPDHLLITAVQKHIEDPDQGRFWPTPAHLFAKLIRPDSDIAAEAGKEFDIDPSIDGTPSFDCQHENQFDRSQRRRQWIQESIAEWHQLTTPRKLAHSKAITQQEATLIADLNTQRFENS